MSATSVVLDRPQHILPIREAVAVEEKKQFDATYQFGNTTVNIIAPKQLTPDQQEKILDDMHRAAWLIIEECISKGIKV